MADELGEVSVPALWRPQNFNPLVVVIRPFGRATVFRFYPAFMDAKRGRPEHLHRLETELFSVVNPVAPA
jgi:hypothetical protein